MSHNADLLARLNITVDGLFYDSKSIFFITEIILILNHISTGNLNPRTTNIILFEIITKYCQLVESFAALIDSFSKSNRGIPKTENILNNLVDYSVPIMLKDYRFFNSFTPLIPHQFNEKISYAWGYNNVGDSKQKDTSIHNIIDKLTSIFQTYFFYLSPYNANKHGSRVFHFGYKEKDNNKVDEPVIYLDESKYYNKEHINELNQSYHLDYVPISSNLVKSEIMPKIDIFASLYELLLDNNRAIVEKNIEKIQFYEQT
jgi:hypothetical protein